ncbi:MAG: 3-carboxy-cis,cis-muconate cycloisomerase [Candidatus Dormiibacterota bacterium]
MFGAIFGRGAAAGEVTATAFLQAMLEVEAALARVQAAAGLITPGAATAIADACDASLYDVGELAAAAAQSAQPAIPVVGALRDRVGPDVAHSVHRGATSQDVVDTAAMLVARRALLPILDDAGAAAERVAGLARLHARAPMLGRTLLQAAEPTTFGLKAAGWLVALDEARSELARVRVQVLAVQLGGAVGTLASYGDAGIALLEALAIELGLAAPALPWHAARNRPAVVASSLGVLAGVAGKIGRDVTLLAQEEVGEARERPQPGRGGSSAMPHKHNPVAAISAIACAARTPGLVGTMLASMVGEHERAAGAWQAEWETWNDLLRLTGAAIAWARESLELLEVNVERMQANLVAAGREVATVEIEAAAALVGRALDAHERAAQPDGARQCQDTKQQEKTT